MRTISPEHAIPTPTPPNSQPMRALSGRHKRFGDDSGGEKKDERTGNAGDAPKDKPHRKGIGKPHREGCRNACDQRKTEYQKTRTAFGNQRRNQCAQEIADKVDRRDQPRDVRTETHTALHERKQRRVEKSPDSHAHRERKKAAEEKPVPLMRIERRR